MQKSNYNITVKQMALSTKRNFGGKNALTKILTNLGYITSAK
jgi:hypothetical protein